MKNLIARMTRKKKKRIEELTDHNKKLSDQMRRKQTEIDKLKREIRRLERAYKK